MDYAELDAILATAASQCSPDISPLNLSAAKEAFLLQGREPVFSYRKAADISSQLAAAEKIVLDDSLLSDLYRQKISSLHLQNDLLQASGSRSFGEKSIAAFGMPSRTTLREAQRILSREPIKTFEEARIGWKALSEALSRIGLPLWQVEKKPMVTLAAVDSARKKIYVNEGKRFITAAQLKRLLVHEIGVHIFRAENGALQSCGLFATGFPDYLKTEEGLAVYMEMLHECLSAYQLRIYAGRALAAKIASEEGFRSTFDAMSQFFERERAWDITARVKRGLHETAVPGAYTKDYIYLEGFLEIKSFLNSGASLDLLYTGKIGMKHAGMLKQLNACKPKYLPQDFSRLLAAKIGDFAD